MGYDTFDKLCRMRGVTAYRVAKETGVTTSTLSSWKAGRYVPKDEKLQKLADYFNIPVQYLRTGEKPNDIDKECAYLLEKAKIDAERIMPGLGFIIDSFQVLDGNDRREVLELIKVKLKKYEPQKKENVG